MKDGLRQLLPMQLQPVAVTTTDSTITHHAIRDIVGISSPRQSAALADDTSSMTTASNRNPRHGCGRGLGELFDRSRKRRGVSGAVGRGVPIEPASKRTKPPIQLAQPARLAC